MQADELRMGEVYMTCCYGNPPHFQEDLSNFSPHFHEWVEMSTSGRGTPGIKVVRLELFCLPGATEMGHVTLYTIATWIM